MHNFIMFHIWLKIASLCLSAVFFHKGLHCPNPAPADKSTMYKGQAFEYLVRYMAAYGEVSIFCSPGVTVV